MTKRLDVSVIFLVLVALLFIGGCAPSFGPLVREKCQKDGCTKEQQYLAEAYAYRLKLTKENPDGTFSPNYAVLPNKEVAEIVKNRLDDLNSVLDYKNVDWTKFIEEFNLRPELEREEKVFKALYSRLRLIDNYNNFKEYMGETSPNRPRELDSGYDASLVFVEDVFKAYPFVSDRIEVARAGGNLKEVERFVWSARRELGRKEPDPNYPDDENKFTWRPEEVGVEFVSYKIIDTPSPRDNKVDYVEASRLVMTKDGFKKESKPAFKLFVPASGYYAVLVLDKDRENEIGFLLPDFVEQVSSVVSAESLATDTIISRLFPIEEKEKRIKPKPLPQVIVEIAPVGKNKVDVWEQNVNGWIIPFKYKNERSDNYSVTVKIKGEDNGRHDPSNPNKQIENFSKEWTGNGRVIERFRPKAPFDQSNIVNVAVSGRRVVFVTTDGNED